jgi:hypothetical protein
LKHADKRAAYGLLVGAIVNSGLVKSVFERRIGKTTTLYAVVKDRPGPLYTALVEPDTLVRKLYPAIYRYLSVKIKKDMDSEPTAGLARVWSERKGYASHVEGRPWATRNKV